MENLHLLFRVEFNEKNQKFHLERMESTRLENTNDWYTIAENLSNYEFKMAKILIDYNENKNYTVKELIKSFETAKRILTELVNQRLLKL
jgi:hypothetical protein